MNKLFPLFVENILMILREEIYLITEDHSIYTNELIEDFSCFLFI